MNVSAFFIKRPVLAFLLFALLTIIGIFGFSQMTIKLFPDVNNPIVVTNVFVPSENAKSLETNVAQKIENKIAGTSELRHIHSNIKNNLVTVIAEYSTKKTQQQALDDVQSAVSQVRSEFPSSAKEPIVNSFDIIPTPLLIYSIQSDTMSVAQLSKYIDEHINKKISSIAGVNSFKRIGGLSREIKVLADPKKLKTYNISIDNLADQINLLQRSFGGGSININGSNSNLKTTQAVENIDNFADLDIILPTGRITKLSKLAKIEDGFKDQTSKALLNGNEGVAFLINRANGYGDYDVGTKVREQIDLLKKENPNLKITEVFERVNNVKQDFNHSMNMLYEGAALAVLVVLLFLGGFTPTIALTISGVIGYFGYYYLLDIIGSTWSMVAVGAILLLPVIIFFDRFRATIVSATALPLSILPAFGGMYLMGISMNIMSTIALSLVVGILVDDAIVEVENIDRHMNEGKTAYQAAMDATDEIGMAVIAITTTLIAVFLPTAFISGMAGAFFYEFGVAASLAIFSSLVVARVVTPTLAAYFLKPSYHKEKDSLLLRAYLVLARIAVRFRWITIILAAGFFYYSLLTLGSLPKALLPATNDSFTMVKVELPLASDLQKTEKLAQQSRDVIKDIADIKNIFTFVGDKGKSKATLFISLKDPENRRVKSEIEQDIRKHLDTIENITYRVSSGNAGDKYELVLAGDDDALLKETSLQIVKEIETIKGLGKVYQHINDEQDEIAININQKKAMQKGVNAMQIAKAIRIATVGDYEMNLPKFNDANEQIPIVVKVAKASQNLKMLKNLMIPSARGMVKISDVADLKVIQSQSEIERYDRERVVKIIVPTLSMELGDVKDSIDNLPTMKNLPKGVKQISMGDAQVMQELGESFAIAMSFAILCIYGVLVLLFNRLLQPITILSALPLAIGGSAFGLVFMDASMSLSAMVGFLMLMGIAVKNSILLVEYAIVFNKNNPTFTKAQAVLDACRKRARPIIMTSIAMGAGMLPIILGLGEGDYSLRQPMAVAVFGGLITSTILSLIVVPAFYTIVEDFSQIVRKTFGKK